MVLLLSFLQSSFLLQKNYFLLHQTDFFTEGKAIWIKKK